MSIQLKKVLRTISKVVLVLAGVFLLGYVGYSTYLSIAFKPAKVRVTNITSSSATVSWVTESPMKGVVYYGEKDSFLPGPLGWIGSDKAWDDRDVSDAEVACVEEYNSKMEVDGEFAVDMSDFDCTDTKVKKFGKYYTHHVTLKGLDSEKQYYFRVGDGVWGWSGDVNSAKTFSMLGSVEEPKPVFGRVVTENGLSTEDSVVYLQFKDLSESSNSVWMSAVANEDGGWYLDGSNLRDASGNVVGLELGQDMFTVRAQYKANELAEEIDWVFGYFNQAYPDIVVESSSNVVSLGAGLMQSVRAYIPRELEDEYEYTPSTTTSYTDTGTGGDEDEVEAYTRQDNAQDEDEKEEVSYYGVSESDWATYDSEKKQEVMQTIGAGNAAKLEALNNGGDLTVAGLDELGLGGNAVKIAGNMSAIMGSGNAFSASTIMEDSKDVNSVKSDIKFEYSYSGNSWTQGTTTPVEVPDPIVPAKCGDGECNGSESSLTCSADCPADTYGPEYCAKHPSAIECAPSCPNNVCGVGEDYYSCPADCPLRSQYIMLDYSEAQDLKWGDVTLKTLGENTIGIEGGDTICIGVTTNSNNCDLSFSPISLDLESLVDVVILGGEEVDVEYLKEIIELTKENYTEQGYMTYEVEKLTDLLERLDEIGIEIEQPIVEEEPVVIDPVEEDPVAIPVETPDPDPEPLETPAPQVEVEPEVEGTPQPGSYLWDRLVKSVHAEETKNTTNSSYFYLPEYGFYTLSLNNWEIAETIETGGNTVYLFYIEANSIEGLQIPEDPDNPAVGEDIVIRSGAFEIEYSQTSSGDQLSLQKGINIVSFEDVLAIDESGVGGSAMELILWAQENGIDLETVTYFEGGRWANGVHCDGTTKESCSGIDFEIMPGYGYLIISGSDAELGVPSYDLESSVPVAFSPGWNLIGVHGYQNAFTARTLIDSVSNIEGLTADNVSWWPTSKSRYEGIQVTNGQTYGQDFSISSNNGYFVRISEYEPTDSDCKSIIWHYNGELNGSCGNSQSIF